MIDMRGSAATSCGTFTYIDMQEIATPAPPAADRIRIYAVADANFTVLETITDLGVINRINQDTFRVARNTSGGALAKGAVVYFSGSTGNKPNFSPAQANAIGTMPAVGVLGTAVSNNQYGEVMLVGRISGIKTNYTFAGEPTYAPVADWTEGDILYVNDTVLGGLQNSKPTHPNFSQWVATIEKVHATQGIILVKVQAMLGLEDGTNSNSFTIGDTAGGVKSLKFDGTADSTLQWDSTSSYWAFTSGNVGIGIVTPSVKCHIIGQEWIQSGNAIFGLKGGADYGATTITNDTRKFFVINSPSYRSTTEPDTNILNIDNFSATNSTLRIGGGLASVNAVNNIYFYTDTGFDTVGNLVARYSNTGQYRGYYEAIFNYNANDNNTTIKGDTDVFLGFFDAGADRVGFGTGTPSTKVHILNGANDQLRLGYDATNYGDLFSDSAGQVWIKPTSHIILFSNAGATKEIIVNAESGAVYANNNALSLGTAGDQNIFIVNTGESIFNTDGVDINLRIEGADDVNLGFFDAGANRFGVGDAAPDAKMEVNQNVVDAAIPVISLTQADVDQAMMKLSCTIGVGNGIEAVGGKTLTVTHFEKVTVDGVGDLYRLLGTIA